MSTPRYHRDGLLPAAVVLLLCVLALIAERRAVAVDFGFDQADRTEGWQVLGNPRGIEVANGRLRIAARDRDVGLVYDRPIDADAVRWVRIRLRFLADTTGAPPGADGVYEAIHHELSFAWIPEGHRGLTAEAIEVTDVVFDGRFHTYDLLLGDHALWRGNVAGLRIDPLDVVAPPGTLDIDRVAFLAHRPTRFGSWQTVLVLAALWWGTLLVARRARPPGQTLARVAALAATALLLPASLIVLVELTLNLAGFEHADPDKLVSVVFDDVEAPGYDALFRYDPRTLYINREGALYRPGERINELGLRGPVYGHEPPPRTLRIACFGDSTTFGLGVGLAESYPEQLRVLLERRIRDAVAIGAAPPYDRVEVINAGVIAYSIAQSSRLFETRIADFDVDVITLALSNMNDYLPGRLSDPERLELAARTPVWRFEARHWLVPRSKLFQLMTRWRAGDAPARSAGEGLRPRVDGKQYDEYLARFLDLAREQRAELVLVSFPRHPRMEAALPVLLDYTERMRRFAAAEGLLFVDVRAQFAVAPDYPSQFFDMVHLGPAGNATVAQALAETIGSARIAAAGQR